jgi:hypothetical protein
MPANGPAMQGAKQPAPFVHPSLPEKTMNQRIASALAFGCSVAAATLAATAMSSTAWADDITIDTTPFVSQRSRAEVVAEMMADRASLSSAGNEWVAQQSAPLPTSDLTRAQARSDYIAAREEVLARNSEGGGSATMAVAPKARVMPTIAAVRPVQ